MSASSLNLFLFLALAGGGNSSDLVSWIKAEDYFKARGVEVTPAAMVRLATQEPKDGKTSIAQLLALRWLGQHPNEVKKVEDPRPLLELIAQGKKAQDPQGFAKDYAAAALVRLAGKAPPAAPAIPANSVREDALKWFPEHVAVAGAFDLRGGRTDAADAERSMHALLDLVLHGDGREQLYDFADHVGNFRVDRAAIAVSFDPVKPDRGGRIYVRVTGRGNPARLTGFILANTKETIATEGKTADGQPTRRIETKGRLPGMLFVGDTEFLMLVEEGANAKEGGGNLLVDEVLAVMAGKKKNALSGRLADLIKRAPANAEGLFAADWPEEMRNQFLRGGTFTTFPPRMVVDLATDKKRALRWHGSFDRPEDAKAFAEDVARLKQKGIDVMKGLTEDDLKQAKIDKETITLLVKALEGIKAEADGKTVSGGMELPAAAIKAALQALLAGRGAP